MSETFGAYSQLARKCAVCPKVSTCDHKKNGASWVYYSKHRS